MKFVHLVNEVFCRPWLITEASHASIRYILRSRLGMSALEWQAKKREGEDLSGNAVAVPQMVVDDGIAIIPIAGVILKGVSAWERGAGAVGVEDISADVREAVQSDEVSGIFFDVDSPGGTVGGVPELAAEIAAIKKPTMAFTDGMMASAAYWLAAGVEDIEASPAAEVGSIGVYLPWIDESEAFKAEGVTVDIIRNEGADLKGMGFPGTSLTDSQREALQESVNEIAEMFHGAVLKARGIAQADRQQVFRGQTFMAGKAKRYGLIDGVMTRESALLEFRKTVNG